MKIQKRLIAEFEMQSYTQIIFPHENTDWVEYLQEAEETFINIINAIRKHQKCLVVCKDVNAVKQHFNDAKNLTFIAYETDDTWARDCSALSIEENGKKKLLDFTFNAWGGKFISQKDNAMTHALTPNAVKCDFVLEGGAIESNGVDTILTTSACIFNKNRNPHLKQEEIIDTLKQYFGASKILVLKSGYLVGDDTDSHIDTLARFIDKKTIMYVQCCEKTDEHFYALRLMEKELQCIAKEENYTLIALPMADAIYFQEERLPATYANFLFVNGAVLVPVYGVKSDTLAINIFKNSFKNHKIIPINCATLIKQHGSLHCVSMNM